MPRRVSRLVLVLALVLAAAPASPPTGASSPSPASTTATPTSTYRHRHLYTVPVDGGFPERLPVPTAYDATFSPDGSHLAYDTASREVTRLTDYRDFPVQTASSGGGRIVYEQGGYRHLFDPASGTDERLVLGVPADLVETRPRYESGVDLVREADLSPSGARAVFELRGEIVSVPAENGSARNLTRSLGAHERSPAWAPDGRSIAWFSDASGEYL
jgi:hypothetical protein